MKPAGIISKYFEKVSFFFVLFKQNLYLVLSHHKYRALVPLTISCDTCPLWVNLRKEVVIFTLLEILVASFFYSIATEIVKSKNKIVSHMRMISIIYVKIPARLFM